MIVFISKSKNDTISCPYQSPSFGPSCSSSELSPPVLIETAVGPFGYRTVRIQREIDNCLAQALIQPNFTEGSSGSQLSEGQSSAVHEGSLACGYVF
jgi:hypothetical protein